MDELVPPHALAPTPAELGRLRVRMADAVAGCVGFLTTVAALSETTPLTAASRRERCDGMCSAINSSSELAEEFHEIHRRSGGGWPADAPTGLTFTAVALKLHDGYLLSCELGRVLYGSECVPGPRTTAQSAALRRAVRVRIVALRQAMRVLDDAAEYLRCGGEWAPPAPLDKLRVNAVHRAEATAASEYGVLVLDHITNVDGRQVPITGNSCLVVPGRVPTVCTHADPRIGPTLMRLVRGVLLEGVQRELLGGAVLPDGATLHWIGRVAASRGSGTCPCYPTAPTAAPAHAHLWGGVVHGVESANCKGSGSVAPSSRRGQGRKPKYAPATARNIRDVIDAAHTRSGSSKPIGSRGWRQSIAVVEAVERLVKDGTCVDAESVWRHYASEASRLRGKRRNFDA